MAHLSGLIPAGRPEVSDEEFAWWRNQCIRHNYPLPVIIQDEGYLEWADQWPKISAWNISRQIVASAKPQLTANIQNWESMIMDIMSLNGNKSVDGLQRMKQSRVLCQESTGASFLSHYCDPPEALRWPYDSMITFSDYLAQ